MRDDLTRSSLLVSLIMGVTSSVCRKDRQCNAVAGNVTGQLKCRGFVVERGAE